MRAYFTCPVDLGMPNDYPPLDDGGETYAIWNRYSVELPPGMDDGEKYLDRVLDTGELWRLAVYEDTYDSNGHNLDRPNLPDLRDMADYEDTH